MGRSPRATLAYVAAPSRPLWARVLDVASDVVFGVTAVVTFVLLLASVAALVGTGDTSIGGWLVTTGSALLGPLEGPVDAWITIAEADRDLAATLLVGAVAWAGAGWIISVLLRPG